VSGKTTTTWQETPMTTTEELQDPGQPVRSERAKVRRDLLKVLRTVASEVRLLVSLWDSSRRVWGVGHYASDTLRPDGRPYAQGWRWRLWHEYPENNPTDLRRTAARLRNLANHLNQLAAEIGHEMVEAQDAAAKRASEAGKP